MDPDGPVGSVEKGYNAAASKAGTSIHRLQKAYPLSLAANTQSCHLERG